MSRKINYESRFTVINSCSQGAIGKDEFRVCLRACMRLHASGPSSLCVGVCVRCTVASGSVSYTSLVVWYTAGISTTMSVSTAISWVSQWDF